MQLAEAGIPVWDILRQNVDELFGAGKGQQFRQRMQQMTDALVAQGTPLADAQAQAQTAGTQALMKMVSGGKLSSTKVIAALRKGMVDRFGGLGEKQAGTMSGELSNLSDAWKSLMGDMVQGAFGPGKSAIEGLTDMLTGLRGTLNTLPDSFKTVLGIGTVLAGGVGAIGGLTGGLGGVGGVLGSLFGGGGGGNPILPLLLAISLAIGLLLVPLQGVWDAVKGALHVLVDNWPSGGGGAGGGFPGGGAVPALTAPLLLIPDHDDAQRKIEAWPALVGKLGITAPAPTTVQAQIDGWTLTKTLLLGVPGADAIQALIGAWPALTKTLSLLLPDYTDVQRAIGKLPDFSHAMQLSIPGWSAIQLLLDQWPALSKSLGLMPTAPQTIQEGIDKWPELTHALGLNLPESKDVQLGIDAWSDFTHKLGLELPPFETPQTDIDAWADFMHKIGVELPTPDVPQRDINLWPDFLHHLNLSLVSNNDLQQLINMWPKFEHSMDLQIPSNAQVQEALNRYDLKLNVGMNVTAPAAPTVPNAPGTGVIGPDGKPHGVAYYPDFPGGPAVAHQYAMGGIVPGPLGAPQLAIVHGGEEVTRAGRAGAGQTVHFNNYGMLAGQDVERWLRGMLDKLERKGG